MTLLLEMFTYPFIVRAFAARGAAVAVCGAAGGAAGAQAVLHDRGRTEPCVLRGAVRGAGLRWAPLPVSIPVVIVAALGLLRMTERSRMGADAAIAVVSASSLAVGVIVTSLTTA